MNISAADSTPRRGQSNLALSQGTMVGDEIQTDVFVSMIPVGLDSVFGVFRKHSRKPIQKMLGIYVIQFLGCLRQSRTDIH